MNSLRLISSRISYKSLNPCSSFSYPTRFQQYCSTKDVNNQTDKFRSQETVFNQSRGKEVFQNPVEATTSQIDGDRMSSIKLDASATADDDSHVSAYSCSENVSLNAVMQSNVPEPFSRDNGKAPTHLNMPGGNWSQNQKYLSEQRHGAHQSNQGCIDNKSLHIQSRKYHNDKVESAAPLNQRQKLKQAVRDYGATVVVFHVTISLASLGGCYLAISSGLDVAALLNKLDILASLNEKVVAGGGTFVIAYAVHKLFAPVRIGITLFASPLIVSYLRKKGILKPMSAKKLNAN